MSQFHGQVKRVAISGLTITAGASATTSAAVNTPSVSGLLQAVLIKTPAAVDSSATMILTLVDAEGYTVYTSASLAANTRTLDNLGANATIKVPLPVAGVLTALVTYSVAQTVTSSTTNVTLLVQGY